jgi:hypothetical protein
MAIFPYDAQQEDELSFPADAILEILDHTNPSGWFKARLGDQVGLIPSTYVQPIDAHHQRKDTDFYRRLKYLFTFHFRTMIIIIVYAMKSTYLNGHR